MRTFLAGVAAATLWTGAACAQSYAPPMDMSPMIQRQYDLQEEGDRRAAEAARQYYDYMQQLRAQGYTGPSAPTGITPGQLQDSVEGANAATQRYIQGAQRNSDRRLRAIDRWDQQAIRGR